MSISLEEKENLVESILFKSRDATIQLVKSIKQKTGIDLNKVSNNSSDISFLLFTELLFFVTTLTPEEKDILSEEFIKDPWYGEIIGKLTARAPILALREKFLGKLDS